MVRIRPSHVLMFSISFPSLYSFVSTVCAGNTSELIPRGRTRRGATTSRGASRRGATISRRGATPSRRGATPSRRGALLAIGVMPLRPMRMRKRKRSRTSERPSYHRGLLCCKCNEASTCSPSPWLKGFSDPPTTPITRCV